MTSHTCHSDPARAGEESHQDNAVDRPVVDADKQGMPRHSSSA